MRILVTGGNGFIGKFVISALLKKETEIFATYHKNKPIENINVNWIRTNLLDDKSIDNIIKVTRPEYLIHLAWITKHEEFWNSSENFKWINASVKLLDIFRKYGGKRVFYCGSCAEYDWSYSFFTEGITPLNPSTIYGKSKDIVRQFAIEYGEINNLHILWGRIFFPYGPGEPSTKLIPSIVKSFRSNEEIKWRNSNVYRDFIHVEDVASAIVHLITSNIDAGVYNIGSGDPKRVSEIIEKCRKCFGENFHYKCENVPNNDQDISSLMIAANVTKIYTTGWKPMINIDEGIELYVKYLLNKSETIT